MCYVAYPQSYIIEKRTSDSLMQGQIQPTETTGGSTADGTVASAAGTVKSLKSFKSGGTVRGTIRGTNTETEKESATGTETLGREIKTAIGRGEDHGKSLSFAISKSLIYRG